MNTRKPACIMISLLLCYGSLKAQRTVSNLGKITAQDFILPASPCIDSSTGAVILADIGDLHFEGNTYGGFSWVFKQRTRIKIINQKAFEIASLSIPFYKSEYLKVYDLGASTYSLENGIVKEVVLPPADIYEKKLSRHLFEKKFTARAVKEGSIVEYTYTIKAAGEDIPDWQFQHTHYPCLWSEFRVSIPKLIHYVFVKQGIHDFCVNEGEEGTEGYKVTLHKNDGDLAFRDHDLMVTDRTVNRRWAMKDIPPFAGGDYISAAANYIDKIEFQLSDFYNGEENYSHNKTWLMATKALSQSAYFGKPLREDKSWLDDLLRSITTNLPDQLSKAKAIYYYVNNNFTCTNFCDYTITTTLQEFINGKRGTVGDINLLLTTMLLEEGISADPVLLSTRNFGFNSANYPLLSRFNYVICRTTINSKIYYLDASHTELGFGQLPGECYNGHARIISLLDSGSVYFYADSLKEKKITMVSINTNNQKEMEGSYQSIYGYLESYDTRKTIKASDKKNFFKTIQASYGSDLEMRNAEIDSLNKPEFPVKVHYDFNLKQTLGSPIIYLNPMFAGALHENPFPAGERKYPIEMSHATDELYTFTMEIPDGYTVDELPKSARIAYNGNEGLFEYLIARQENSIQLRCRIKLDRAQFPAEDYNSLRDFYAFIIKKQNEEIILKKQN